MPTFQKYHSALMRKIRPLGPSNYNEMFSHIHVRFWLVLHSFILKNHPSLLYCIIAIGNTYFDVHCSEYGIWVWFIYSLITGKWLNSWDSDVKKCLKGNIECCQC